MNEQEIQTNLEDVDQLLKDHAQEANEVIAAHSILPILRNVLVHLQNFEISEDEEDEEDDDERQYVLLSIPLLIHLHNFLMACIASEEIKELVPDLHRDALRLAAQLQGEIDGRSPAEVLLEMAPGLLEQLELEATVDVDVDQPPSEPESPSQPQEPSKEGEAPNPSEEGA